MPFAQQDNPDLVFGGLANAAQHDWPGLHALPAGSSVKAITSIDGFLALKDDWRQLESTAPACSVFQSFDWLNSWASVYATAPDAPQPLVITGYVMGRLVFALPLMSARLGPLKLLRWMSEPLSQYGDALVAAGQCPKAWLAAAIDHISALHRFDVIRLRHVRSDAIAAPFLAQRFRDAQVNEQAPWLDLSAYADEAAYDARYTSSQRKRRKKIRKALEDDFGPVAFEMLEAGPECDKAIAEAIAEKCQWLDERGRQNKALCEIQTVAFLKQLSRASGGAIKLVTSRMTAGGKPVSWEIGVRCGDTHFGFVTSHVTALTDYSPGRLHMDQSQRQALKDGMKAFDLMVPNDAHKDSWCSAKVDTRDYYLALSGIGRLYGAGYLETARPLLRKAYYRMSPQILRLLKPFTGH